MHEEDIGGKMLQHWTPDDVAAAHAQHRIVLIDVRTPQEYLFEHVKGSILAPMAGLDPADLPEGGTKPIVFHCGSGVRSRKVAEAWLAAGHELAAHMEGGFGAWKTALKPYVGVDPATGAPRLVGG